METNWYVVKVMPGKERTLNEEFNKRISMGKLDNITRFVTVSTRLQMTLDTLAKPDL